MNDFLFKPSYLAELCQSYGLTPSKQFGQNYLINKGVIQNIISASEVSKKDIVVEVGPGFGVLTLALAETAQKVVAFEIEKKLQEYWSETVLIYPNVHVVWGNVLNTLETKIPSGQYKVVANLPYQITGKILVDLLTLPHPPISMTVMVQKEVAERIVAKPGDMSVLSVIVQLIGSPKIAMIVSPGSFFPAPKVHSAVVHIADIKQWNNDELEKIITLVKQGFQNKRKQLVTNLSGKTLLKERILQVLKTMNLSPTIRAQELSINEWKEFSKLLFE